MSQPFAGTQLLVGGQPLALGPELGRGGQGAVYAVEGRDGEVAKLYLKPPDAAQLGKLARLTQMTDEALLAVSAWPLALIGDAQGQTRGFTMPRLGSEYHELHSLYTPASRAELFPEADWGFLVHTARNVARAFATLHAHGVVMGDVSARNVLVSPRGTVRLIDTDSFQVAAFPCPVGTPEFTPPELQGRSFGELVRTPQHDLFGLATLVFHLLFQGRHPYAGIQPASEILSPAEAIAQGAFAYSAQPRRGVKPPPGTLRLGDLPDQLAEYFERAFAATPTGGRPSAEEWEAALASLSAGLERCAGGHLHPRGKPCPWCRLHPLARMGGRAFDLSGRLDAAATFKQLDARAKAVPMPPPPIPAAHIAPAPRQGPKPLLLPLPPPSSAETAWLWLGRGLLLLALAALLRLLFWLGPAVQAPLVLLALFSVLSDPVRDRVEARLPALMHRPARWWVGLYGSERLRRREELEARHAELLRVQRRVQAQLTTLAGRLSSGAAGNKVQRALRAAAKARAEAVQVQQGRNTALEHVLAEYREQALAAYLARQRLTLGLVRGLRAGDLRVLQQAGLHTAADLTADALRPLSLADPQKAALLRYRHSLEDFYAFDPSGVPPRVLAQAYKAHQRELRAALARYERRVEQLERAGMALGENLEAKVARLKRELLDIAEELEGIESLLGLRRV